MKITIEDCRSTVTADKLDAIDHKLNRILRVLGRVLEQGDAIMADLSPIATEVTEISGVVDSTVALIDRLADELEAAATDPVAIAALATDLRAQKQELADAVAAHAEPGPVEPPVEPPA